MAFTIDQLKANHLYQLRSGRHLIFKALNKKGLPIFFPPGEPDFENCFALQRWTEMIARDLGLAAPEELRRPQYQDEDEVVPYPRPLGRRRNMVVTDLPTTTLNTNMWFTEQPAINHPTYQTEEVPLNPHTITPMMEPAGDVFHRDLNVVRPATGMPVERDLAQAFADEIDREIVERIEDTFEQNEEEHREMNT